MKKACILTVAALHATTGYGAEDGSSMMIEEIIVTAEKRSASVQDVGIAISALDAQTIERLNARDIADLQGIVPNLVISEQGLGPSMTQLAIRGVSSQDPEKSFDPAVGTFIDGVYLGTSAYNLIHTFDLERIEVMRGPQGTLFGRNTTGGVIYALRSRPTGEFGVKAGIVVGSAERRDLKAVINTPKIGEHLAFKIAGYLEQDDGLYDNDTPGGPTGEKDRWSTSLAAEFTPTDTVDLLLTWDHAEDDSELSPYLPRGRSTPSPLPVDITETDPPVPATITAQFPADVACSVYGESYCAENDASSDLRANGPHFQDSEMDAITLNGTWAVSDGLQIDLIAGIRDAEEEVYIDFDGTPGTIFDVARLQEYEQSSLELRLASDFEGSWNFVVGGFWFESEYSLRQAIKLDLADVGAPVPPLALYINGNGDEDDHEAVTQALFAHVDYRFNDAWKLTLGGRVSWDEREIETRFYTSPLGPTADYQVTDGIPPGRTLTSSGSAKEDWTEFTPKVALTWEPRDTLMAYASWTRGYNAGGFSARAGTVPAVTTPFDPETIDAWEIGFKTDLLDRRLRLNAALFFNDYQDKQEEAIEPAPPPTFTSTTVRNVASAEIAGLEVEISAFITERFRIDANLGLLDAEYDEYDGFLAPAQYSSTPPQPPNTLIAADFSTLEMRRAPEITASVIPTYETPLGRGTLTLYSIVRYVDEMAVDFFNDERGMLDSQWIVDASIAYEFGGEDGYRYEAKLYGKNLTDEQEFSSFTNSIVDFARVQYPRTWALELTARF